MITAHKLYLALREAPGVSEAAAEAAAAEVGEFMRIREELAVIRSEVSGLKWMFGFTWVLVLAVLGTVVQVLVKLP